MKKIKLVSLLIVVSLMLTMFVGCGGGAASDGETIKIGVIAPLTGDVAVYGTAVKNGVELYFEELNAAGGIAGKQVELIVYDDQGDATEAINSYNKLVTADEVVAIVGAVTSTPTIAVAEASAADNMPTITASATHNDVTTYGNNMFRSCFLDAFQGETMANFTANEIKAQSAAIIYNSSDAYSTGLADAFEAKCTELGIKVVAKEAYAATDVDYRAQLTNIATAKPEVLFMPDYYNNIYKVATQAKEVGINAPMLSCDGADGVLTIEGMDAANVEGLYFANHYSTEDEAEIVQNFLTNFNAKIGEAPNAFAALAYDAGLIMTNAIEKAIESGVEIGTPEFSQAVIDNLDATDVTGVTGQITYDENNNPQKTCAIIKVEAGEYKFQGQF